MSNERERLAREWAKDVDSAFATDRAIAARDYILATTKEPTMAGAQWDDKKHHLTGAVFELEGSTCPVAMVGETRDGDIYAIDLNENHGFWPMPADLTPNGKRYKLVEDVEPAHPATLATVEDYDQAPEGTIVAATGSLSTPLVKRFGKWCRDRLEFTGEELAPGDPIRVLRWGWGE